MYILVTGSEGFIGKNVKKYIKEHFKEYKYDILELDIKGNISVDATDENSVKEFFESNKDKKIKYIINCIGIPDSVPLSNESILDVDYNYFKKMMDINLNAIFLVIKECYRFNKNNLKHIINISSFYSVISPRLNLYDGKIKNPAYTSSKHGLIGLTKHIAVLFAKDKIGVNCISPGGVKESIKNTNFIEKYNKEVPMETTIPLEEIFKTITYLLEMNCMTGQNIIIDGGYSII